MSRRGWGRRLIDETGQGEPPANLMTMALGAQSAIAILGGQGTAREDLQAKIADTRTRIRENDEKTEQAAADLCAELEESLRGSVEVQAQLEADVARFEAAPIGERRDAKLIYARASLARSRKMVLHGNKLVSALKTHLPGTDEFRRACIEAGRFAKVDEELREKIERLRPETQVWNPRSHDEFDPEQLITASSRVGNGLVSEFLSSSAVGTKSLDELTNLDVATVGESLRQKLVASDDPALEITKKIVERAVEHADRSIPGLLGVPPRRAFLEMGRALAREGDLSSFSGKQIGDVATYVASKGIAASHKLGITDSDHILEESATYYVCVAQAWGLSGFPSLQPTHKLAASLMATHVPRELVPDIAMPWSTVMLEVPDGIVPGIQIAMLVELSSTKEEGEPRFRILFYGGNDAIVSSVRELDSLAELSESVTELSDRRPLRRVGAAGDDEHDRANEEHVRAAEVVGRLFLNCLIELATEKKRRVIAQGPPASKTGKRGRTEPRVWTFQLSRDVVHDCRPWVREYVARGEAKRRSPGVQWLVRGHQKRQHHGPRNTLVKWIHIEPYWAGAEDGPIAIRSHRLVGGT